MREKKINKRAKKASQRNSEVHVTLKDQYEVIKQDVLKLRDDLSRGYDLVRNLVEKKTSR